MHLDFDVFPLVRKLFQVAVLRSGGSKSSGESLLTRWVPQSPSEHTKILPNHPKYPSCWVDDGWCYWASPPPFWLEYAKTRFSFRDCSVTTAATLRGRGWCHRLLVNLEWDIGWKPWRLLAHEELHLRIAEVCGSTWPSAPDRLRMNLIRLISLIGFAPIGRLNPFKSI